MQLFFFLKDKKLKKLAVTLKLLTVLSLNSNVFLLVLFACKDSSPLYKPSKTRNHLNPENFETLFLLSALKMPIKSVNSYQEKIKILRKRLTLLWFCNCIFVFQHSIVFLFNVGNKIFCFFKNWIFPFLEGGTFQGGGRGVKFSKILRGVAHKGGGLTDLEFFIFLGGRGGGLGKKGWGQYFKVGWYLGGHCVSSYVIGFEHVFVYWVALLICEN